MNRSLSLIVSSIAALGLPVWAQNGQLPADAGYPITPVAFTQVRVAEASFWGQRLEASRSVTIPLAFSKCESEGRYKNFENAAAHLKDPAKVFKIDNAGFSFDDTDPYKTIEGASYVLSSAKLWSSRKGDCKKSGSQTPLLSDPRHLEHYVDSIIDIIGSAQEPDGYLYTARTQNPDQPHHWAGKARWTKEEELSHELYNLGHMAEAAVAHWQATGSRKLLDIARRYADCVVREVGPAEGQACVVPGHQIAEMALARLYLATGERKYLDEAKFLLDYRGKTTIKHDYSQAHKPVTDQDEAVGHAVRAAYMYAGMADVAALTGDSAYIRAIDRIWNNIVAKKLYITGGIGATSNGEAFGPNYYLPNASAYCETCAAIGNVYVNYRLFLLHGESKYYDVLERTLYNGLLAGVSLDGGSFFYPNVLESAGGQQRQDWFGCACCPSNICRFIPSLPGYVYAVKEFRSQGVQEFGSSGVKELRRDSRSAVYVNLFLPNSTTLAVAGKTVALTQQTQYPWDGDVAVIIDKNWAGRFSLKLRIPGWAKSQPVPSDLYSYADGEHVGITCAVNGTVITQLSSLITPDGYITIDRRWKKGDCVRLHFDMPVRTVRAHEAVEADRGKICVERGPLVYCAESADNQFDIMAASISPRSQFEVMADAEIRVKRDEEGTAAYRLTKLSTDARVLTTDGQGLQSAEKVRLTLVPYYAWCHRGRGNMRVWFKCF